MRRCPGAAFGVCVTRSRTAHEALVDDPLWFKDAVIYELRVRSYMDKSGDGIGDFAGLTDKLDYLQDLGVTALWLLPINPSPGRDDGYDISDYTDIHPDVGTVQEFKTFLDEAHRRGLRVITELVLNHTSDQHPWFQRARRAPKGSPERDFYVWSDTPDRYKEARIIFKDFEPSNWSWDPVARQYFWHRFFAHQPDLNFDNPAVHETMLGVVDFWFNLGVDGLRLDAVPYLYEREGTNCENLDEGHGFLKRLRAHIDSKFKNRMLLAEANQWPEDAAQYFGRGDECHMNFHFPIMPRIFMSLHMEDRLPIIDILAQTPQIPDGCQWAVFLRNHDELTLEMVTDEERDYMYRAYAAEQGMRINLGIRRRLAPLLGNDRRNIELVNALLCSLPGTPVLYYGDEIGMGDNFFLGDRNGVRTPMQWSADRNAGFSRANPQRLILPVIIDPEYHFESINVEAQQNNPNSLLWWTKRLLGLRKRFKAFGRGSIEFLHPDNNRVLAFVRQFGDETVLIVANLSRFTQYVELDLSKYRAMVPTELFGRSKFPPIGELPYLLTLGGHAFYWFSLTPAKSSAAEVREAGYATPTLKVSPDAADMLWGEGRALVEEALPAWLERRRWFQGDDRQLTEARIVDAVLLPSSRDAIHLTVARVTYSEGEDALFALPLGVALGEEAQQISQRSPQAVIARLRGAGKAEGVLYDALADLPSSGALLEAMARGLRARSGAGEMVAAMWQREPGGDLPALEPRALKGSEQSSAEATFGDRYVLKFQRRLEEGDGAEVDIGRFLARRPPINCAVAPVASLEYRPVRGEPMTVATLQPLVPNEAGAWAFTREELGRYFERALARPAEGAPVPPPAETPLQLAAAQPPDEARALIGGFLEAARLMGARIAELHLTLASDSEDASFASEPYSALGQRSSYQTMRNVCGRVLRQLREGTSQLEPAAAALAKGLLAKPDRLYKRIEPLRDRRLTAHRLRTHGDLQLMNLLYTGKDFVVVDFAGDKKKPAQDRRRKRSPLRDVACMLRSFDYAAGAAVLDEQQIRPADRATGERWARLWVTWVQAAFLGGYLSRAGDATFVPRDRAELAVMVEAFQLEKALEQLGDDLAKRSPRAIIALQFIDSTLA